MSVNPQARIVIRHLSGSKVNQVEQIPIRDLHEITIGRDPNSGIAYDPRRDDVVSREHAAIRIENGDNLAFRLIDLNSSNGTFLNGAPITDEVELLPEDTIELGPGGPRFTFDVQPRPDNLASRTRVMGAIDATATRAIAGAAASVTGTAEHRSDVTGTSKIDPALAAGTRQVGGAGKAVVGKETVLRMLFQERQKSSRVWMSSIAAVVAVLIVAGGGLYWHSRTVATQLREEAAQRSEQARLEAERNVTRQLGATARDIVNKYGGSTVQIQVVWRMHDRDTGKALFQKVVFDQKTKELHPAFIRLPNGKLLRWLTLEDPERHNIAIRGVIGGSGFVVSDKGFILTNKHLAAGWMVPFEEIGTSLNKQKRGIVFPYARRWRQKTDYVSLESSEIRALQRWVPEFGGPLFSQTQPMLLDGNQTLEDNHLFNGVNERLEIRFPGERISTNASLIRASTDADVALIRVDSVSALRPVELSEDDKFDVGDKVIVLGYPAISPQAEIRLTAVENARITSRPEVIPAPTVTEGIISVLGQKFKQEGEFTLVGAMGDTFQMTINATGEGNSGGPVFNAKGQVIGLFTYSTRRDQDARATYAVPIHHGRALLKLQPG